MMPRVRAPFKWYGGKSYLVKHLLSLFPEHRTYIEPFCGSAVMLFAKTPAEVETINDLNGGVAGFFRVLRDHPDEFMRLARLSEYSRELWYECRDTWVTEGDPIRRAWKWWYVAATSFAGNWGSAWGTAVTKSYRGCVGTCSSHISLVDEVLPQCIERLRRVQVDCVDGLVALRRYATEDGLAYVDPPYVGETRAGDRYTHRRNPTGVDMPDVARHAELVSLLLETPGAVIVSGYAHPVYEPLESAGWRRIDWPTVCHAVAKTRHTGIQGDGAVTSAQRRVESVWLNPECLRRLGRIPLLEEAVHDRDHSAVVG